MANDELPQLTPIQKQILGEAAKHSGKLIFIGALLVIFGTIGLLAEVIFSFASISILAAAALLGGILMASQAFQAKAWKTFLIQSLFAALYIGLAIFIWVAPVAALEGLTIWLAVMFLVTGAMRLIAALQNKAIGNSGWTALSGVLSIVLGVLILNNWPQAGTWVPGMLLAIELLLQGWTLLFIGLAIKNAGQAKP
jgi:uncharacterized membrane protein HdeD (DUF308 family)